jgi:hypothetical protein
VSGTLRVAFWPEPWTSHGGPYGRGKDEDEGEGENEESRRGEGVTLFWTFGLSGFLREWGRAVGPLATIVWRRQQQ